jgi:hypothetical protein
MSFGRILDIRDKLKSLRNLNPISVVHYQNDFIVWDGRGRTAAYMLSGKVYIPSVVLENDEDIKKQQEELLDPQEE